MRSAAEGGHLAPRAGGAAEEDTGWTCDVDYWGTDDGCDCGCGMSDPDCDPDDTADDGCLNQCLCMGCEFCWPTTGECI